ncbi:hypothetical protein ACVWYN_003278 [Pedobacter sp. UYP24]
MKIFLEYLSGENHFYLRKVKMGKHLLSHRYNFLPLLRSRPGGVQKELIVKDLPGTKVAIQLNLQKLNGQFFRK